MTSHTLSSLSLPRPARSPCNFVARIAQQLVDADARARNRRHLEELPDRLRADAGLPPRSHTEQAMQDLLLRAALMR